MVIALRGTSQTGNSNNGGDVTLTFDTGTPPLEDDIVVIFGGHGVTTTTLTAPAPNAGGAYTQIGIHTGTAPIFGMWYKRMGATPDLSAVCSGGGDNADAVAYGSVVYSGVDTTTAEDATAITVGPNTSENPNPGSITTATVDAFVLAAAGSSVFDNSPGTISGYTDQLISTRNETVDFTTAFARIDAGDIGAEDPAAWGTWASGSWYAITAALRPAPAATQDIEGTFLTDTDDFTLHDGLITHLITASILIDAEDFAIYEGAITVGSVDIEGSLFEDTDDFTLNDGQVSFDINIAGAVLANVIIDGNG